MQMIFQDPFSSLNPRMTIERIVGEPLRIHNLATGSELHDKIASMVTRVGLKAEHLQRYPHEFSGGQRQRIGIARAIVHKPQLLLADEPTGNLDPTLSAEIMSLFMEFNRHGTTVLIASHDLALISRTGRRTLVLDHGRLIQGG